MSDAFSKGISGRAVALGIGLPYYVPTGMFSVSFGGKNSGVVSAYLDTVSFAFSAVETYVLVRCAELPDATASLMGLMQARQPRAQPRAHLPSTEWMGRTAGERRKSRASTGLVLARFDE